MAAKKRAPKKPKLTVEEQIAADREKRRAYDPIGFELFERLEATERGTPENEIAFQEFSEYHRRRREMYMRWLMRDLVDDASLLGVSTSASPDEVKQAWRKKALELHPDRGGDAEAFRAAKEAFDSLMARVACSTSA